MTERRNPYLILGLDFAASADRAAVAFAQISRRLRTDGDAPYSIEDATWALHQIEQAEEEHRTGVTIYRVPADPDIFSDRSTAPAPQPLERTTPHEHDEAEKLQARIIAESLSPALEGLVTMGPDLAYAQDPAAGPTPSDAAAPTRHSGHLPSATQKSRQAKSTPKPDQQQRQSKGGLNRWAMIGGVVFVLVVAGVVLMPDNQQSSDNQQSTTAIPTGEVVTPGRLVAPSSDEIDECGPLGQGPRPLDRAVWSRPPRIGWPPDLPVPKGTRIAGSSERHDGAWGRAYLTFPQDLRPVDIFAFYAGINPSWNEPYCVNSAWILGVGPNSELVSPQRAFDGTQWHLITYE